METVKGPSPFDLKEKLLSVISTAKGEDMWLILKSYIEFSSNSDEWLIRSRIIVIIILKYIKSFLDL